MFHPSLTPTTTITPSCFKGGHWHASARFRDLQVTLPVTPRKLGLTTLTGPNCFLPAIKPWPHLTGLRVSKKKKNNNVSKMPFKYKRTVGGGERRSLAFLRTFFFTSFRLSVQWPGFFSLSYCQQLFENRTLRSCSQFSI